jgi:hypothetical protein
MAQWYDFGYFSDDLEIAFGENSMFLPLHQYKEINLKQNSNGAVTVGASQVNNIGPLSGFPPTSNQEQNSGVPQMMNLFSG